MKTCTACGETKPLSDFIKRSSAPDGLEYRCRSCAVEYKAAYYQAHRDQQIEEGARYREENRAEIRQRGAAYRERNRANLARAGRERFRRDRARHYEINRRSRLKVKYGITPEQYDQLVASQQGLCAICQQPPPRGRSLVIDHDHFCCPGRKTCGNCLRGLLCGPCNLKLGWLERHWPAIARHATGRLT